MSLYVQWLVPSLLPRVYIHREPAQAIIDGTVEVVYRPAVWLPELPDAFYTQQSSGTPTTTSSPIIPPTQGKFIDANSLDFNFKSNQLRALQVVGCPRAVAVGVVDSTAGLSNLLNVAESIVKNEKIVKQQPQLMHQLPQVVNTSNDRYKTQQQSQKGQQKQQPTTPTPTPPSLPVYTPPFPSDPWPKDWPPSPPSLAKWKESLGVKEEETPTSTPQGSAAVNSSSDSGNNGDETTDTPLTPPSPSLIALYKTLHRPLSSRPAGTGPMLKIITKIGDGLHKSVGMWLPTLTDGTTPTDNVDHDSTSGSATSSTTSSTPSSSSSSSSTTSVFAIKGDKKVIILPNHECEKEISDVMRDIKLTYYGMIIDKEVERLLGVEIIHKGEDDDEEEKEGHVGGDGAEVKEEGSQMEKKSELHEEEGPENESNVQDAKDEDGVDGTEGIETKAKDDDEDEDEDEEDGDEDEEGGSEMNEHDGDHDNPETNPSTSDHPSSSNAPSHSTISIEDMSNAVLTAFLLACRLDIDKKTQLPMAGSLFFSQHMRYCSDIQ